MVSIGEESIVNLVDENKLSDTIRNESQIYPQSYCGAIMDAVWNSFLLKLQKQSIPVHLASLSSRCLLPLNEILTVFSILFLM